MENAKHAEYSYKAQGTGTLVIFIHGIQGSPAHFKFIIERLDGKYSIENLLLPGHGRGTEEFARSNMKKWQGYVNNKICRLEKEYDNIILVGHSMGCLLAIDAALKHPGKIRGLFIIAAPLRIHVSLAYIRNNMLYILKKNDKSEKAEAAEVLNSVSASSPIKYITGVFRYFEVYIKSVHTRKLIKFIRLPVTAVHSDVDEIVSNKSLTLLKSISGSKIIIAEGSGHYFYSENAKDIVFKELSEFIKQNTRSDGKYIKN